MNHKMKMVYIIFVLCLFVSACGKEQNATKSDETMDIISAKQAWPSEEENILDLSDDVQFVTDPESNTLNEDVPETLAEETDSDVLEIKEKMFLTQINDIYYNFDSYQDKTIIVEGMYTLLYSWDGSKRIPGVYRKGPGCCGNDGWGGFFLNYDGTLPEENDWIRVTGTPELVVEEGFTLLYLHVASIEVKEERGAEFVMQ